MKKSHKRELIKRVPFWYHSIDCGDGIVTPGRISHHSLIEQLKRLDLPDLKGKSVLDIGCWDGFYAFAAEDLGARRVLALDHYTWSMDLLKQQRYWEECQEKHIIPKPYHLVPGLWKPESLPGKVGFDVAHQIKNSNVEQIVGDFMTIDPLDVGMFDVVFFLGVLYHLENPYQGLKRLSLFTRELAVIETAAVYLEDCEDIGLYEFYESSELGDDVGNWFAPNLTGLVKSCRAAGFKEVIPKSPYPPSSGESKESPGIIRYRLTVHARK